MASKHIQALSAQTLLRVSSRVSARQNTAAATAAMRCIVWPAATRLHSSTPSSCVTVTAREVRPRLVQARQPGRILCGGVRWSTESATGSKIWSFEEIQNLPSNVTLIDVREPGEIRQTGRIPGALNIPITTSPDSFHISEEEFEDRFGFVRPNPNENEEQEVVFYCKAGVRSRAAAGIAREAGWKKVGEYPGSWVEWSGKGGKIER
ncbi:thiosulfate sulfurtransferase [Apiospora sp. TS-2023a]